MKYLTRPEVVEAEQWRPGDAEQAERFGIRENEPNLQKLGYQYGIPTHNWWCSLTIGDWIVTRRSCEVDVVSAANFDAGFTKVA